MPAFEKQDRAARLFKVAQIISVPGGARAVDVANRTGRHKRTALRDILALGEIGVPVYQEGDRWLVGDGYFVPAISFTRPEAVAMLMAGRLAARHADHNDQVLAMALAKIAKAMPKDAQLVAGYFEEIGAELAAKPADAARSSRLRSLVQAWLEKRKVRLDYQDAQGKKSSRVIRPYYLAPSAVMSHGMYVIGFDEKSQEVRPFKLERITGAEILDTQYYLPRDFNLTKFLRHSWGIWSSDPVEKIEIDFSPPAAARVAESVWHSSQKLTKLPKGHIKIEIAVRGLVEILPWILSWGADAKVIQPASLRAAVAEVTGRMGKVYQE
jgi:proteasome accessory factor B